MAVHRMPDIMNSLLAGAALAALSIGGAHGADMPLKAPRFERYWDWSGFYVGGHSGYGWGGFWTRHQSATATGHHLFRTVSPA